MSELWSPAMRKWAKDAHRHGLEIGLTKHQPSRWAGGGAGSMISADGQVRITDSGAVRITDIDFAARITDHL